MNLDENFNLIACAKDEALSILEWVAHHKAVGFDDIMIATNDCTDGTDFLVAEMADHGLVQHYENHVPASKFPQRAAYDHLVNQPFVQDADWLMILDLDEFLNIHIGDGSVQGLARSLPRPVDILVLYWAIFGDNAHEKWQNGLVTELFTTRLPIDHRHAFDTKCLLRSPRNFGQLKNHFPNRFKGNSLGVIDAGGTEIPVNPMDHNAMHLSIQRFKKDRHAVNDMAQINHYATKTIDHFLLRGQRGLGYGKGARYSLKYFRNRNSHRIEDNSIQKYAVKTSRNMATFRDIGRIRDIENDIIAFYQEKFRQLHQDIPS